MSPVNLGTARVVLLVALVVVGVAVLANGFAGGTAATPPVGGVGTTPSSPATGSSPSSSPSKPPRETPSPQVQGVMIQVFNGTSTTGLAGQVQQRLERDGYVAAAAAGNAPSPPVAKTVVYFRGGTAAAQNRSDATRVADTYLSGARVLKLAADVQSIVSQDANVVIILGVDYANAQG